MSAQRASGGKKKPKNSQTWIIYFMTLMCVFQLYCSFLYMLFLTKTHGSKNLFLNLLERMGIVGQGMLLLMHTAALLGDPLEGEVRCMQHMLSPQVMKQYILEAEPAYANNKCYFWSVLNWIIKNTLLLNCSVLWNWNQVIRCLNYFGFAVFS